MPAPVPKSGILSRDVYSNEVEAVKDTVVVRGHSDQSPRNRVGRSQTAVPGNNPRTTARRSHSQDSGGITERNRQPGKSRSGKKGSQHADVIDRLDFTSVGPMFHHDGPFDACAPSRNRQRNMAPIHAWTFNHDEAALRQYGDNAYSGTHAHDVFSNEYPDPPKKKVDAIAEAWGIHEPEPYEEFFAGGGRGDGETPTSSIYNGRDAHNSLGRGTASRRKEENQTARPRMATRRTVPPPQPILVPDPIESLTDIYGPSSSPGAVPKRSKSLMQRIRRMRDAPNVPVSAADYDQPSSPGSPSETSRPTHRSQNSFLGRLAGSNSRNGASQSISEKPEPYVLIEPHNKQLPATPGISRRDGPGDSAPALTYSESNPTPGVHGLGRKTSLIQKVGRVVRGR
ncbi:hypothetical protein AMATHDRAFT_47623 [Amanita thiersii Skay4041]|uniref:Pal1 cell morphology protein n=1 Tax=Amanita thiersii Skay4041 TaxID=703135 RepID=A0A2A9NSR6_9AGAR|nr:hypothetical protein AMATHDRAFT_47623 [Amanita thiersii Skay4041]